MRTFRVSLRYHLAILVLIALVPILFFTGKIVLDQGREQRTSVEAGLQTTVRALAIAVEREITASIRALAVLAASDSLRRGDLRAFQTQAERVVAGQDMWYVVGITDTRGQILASSARAFGTPLPSIADRPYIRNVIATGRPAVSDLIAGRMTGQANISVAVPVHVDKVLRYILFAGIDPGALGKILIGQRIPPDWIAGIADTSQVLIARNRDPARFIGRELIAPLRQAVRAAPQGTGRHPVLDGPDVYSAWQRTETLGWTVTLGVPVAVVDAIVWRSMGRVALLGVVLAVAGGVIAGAWGRRIARAMGALATAAAALGRGATPVCPPSAIAEVHAVGRAIEAAGMAIREGEADRQRRIEAEVANRTKDEFLAFVSHELRGPLYAVMTSARALRMGKLGEQGTAEALARIERSARLQARLIDDLLDISRIVVGKLRVDKQPVHLARIVEEAVSACGAEADEKGVKLRTALEPMAGSVLGDPERLHQVALNLIGNAIKFTPRGGCVEVALRRRGAGAVLTVADTGQGIEPEALPYVFDRFHQGTGAKRYGGLGLGLAIVRYLVEAHGGTVRIDSPGVGEGTVTTVELPEAGL